MTVDPRKAEAVVIGASAGALEALSAILPPLPENYPLPIMIVVHVPPDKKSVLSEILQSKCKLKVKEAQDKEPLQGGVVYIAPPDYHLLVEKDKRLSLSSEEPVLFSRPSIDVLFESAADAYGGGLIGLILTGANQDGAKGMKGILNAGGRAVVQSPDLAYASAMPQAVCDHCPEARVLNLSEIAEYLRKAAIT